MSFSKLLLLLLLPLTLPGQNFHTYVGDIGPDFALIAWGTTAGTNTIGRTSKPYGKAIVRLEGTTELTVTDRNWAVVRNLTPDKEYRYELLINGKKVGDGQIKTWPVKSEKLCFFVIGDYGSGDSHQAAIAAAMRKQFDQQWGTDCPVRFVITVGDNVYGRVGFTFRYSGTGNRDADWDSKFFVPYAPILSRIPFYASPGNHDGNETESRGDLEVYLDNFFFPGQQPARYYRFSYGGFADFFSLDSTTNSESGPPKPIYSENSDQHNWLKKNLAESKVMWKIPYFHHPPFNAGPRHPSAARDLAHFLEAFKSSDVRVVFTGHEHNFQFSKANRQTGNIRYIVSGAGGELRTGSVLSAMEAAQIEGWAPQLHFLAVTIEGKEMRITPISSEPIRVVDQNGKEIQMPIKISAP